jgi:UDP-hydrolysing UDP-N-acetyl-D-glucosamine 2-epimerase
MKRICVMVGSRANYSSVKSVMRAVREHTGLELQLVVAASALLDRYGSVVKLIEQDGYKVAAKVNMLIEGETPITMAKSTGLGLLELPTILDQLQPDIALVVGDRFEIMAMAIAAAYMNIPLAHTMGGEVSGTIDESTRHAVTKLAHIHFPASADAAARIIRLGEPPEHVHNVGCPRIDLVSDILKQDNSVAKNGIMEGGVGDYVDTGKPFVIVSQHPVTTEYGEGEEQIRTTLEAVCQSGYGAIVLWPNADAGSDDVSRGIRKMRERGVLHNMHFFKNLPIDTYVRLMARTVCLVGNSSSGIREGAFIGTPVVNVGTRQAQRERGGNVMDVGHETREIADAIRSQAARGRYESEPIYGDGTAGRRIAEILANKKNVSAQKRITF